MIDSNSLTGLSSTNVVVIGPSDYGGEVERELPDAWSTQTEDENCLPVPYPQVFHFDSLHRFLKEWGKGTKTPDRPSCVYDDPKSVALIVRMDVGESFDTTTVTRLIDALRKAIEGGFSQIGVSYDNPLKRGRWITSPEGEDEDRPILIFSPEEMEQGFQMWLKHHLGLWEEREREAIHCVIDDLISRHRGYEEVLSLLSRATRQTLLQPVSSEETAIARLETDVYPLMEEGDQEMKIRISPRGEMLVMAGINLDELSAVSTSEVLRHTSA